MNPFFSALILSHQLLEDQTYHGQSGTANKSFFTENTATLITSIPNSSSVAPPPSWPSWTTTMDNTFGQISHSVHSLEPVHSLPPFPALNAQQNETESQKNSHIPDLHSAERLRQVESLNYGLQPLSSIHAQTSQNLKSKRRSKLIHQETPPNSSSLQPVYHSLPHIPQPPSSSIVDSHFTAQSYKVSEVSFADDINNNDMNNDLLDHRSVSLGNQRRVLNFSMDKALPLNQTLQRDLSLYRNVLLTSKCLRAWARY